MRPTPRPVHGIAPTRKLPAQRPEETSRRRMQKALRFFLSCLAVEDIECLRIANLREQTAPFAKKILLIRYTLRCTLLRLIYPLHVVMQAVPRRIFAMTVVVSCHSSVPHDFRFASPAAPGESLSPPRPACASASIFRRVMTSSRRHLLSNDAAYPTESPPRVTEAESCARSLDRNSTEEEAS